MLLVEATYLQLTLNSRRTFN